MSRKKPRVPQGDKVIIPGDNVPNLDCMEADELREFWLSTIRYTKNEQHAKARELFPSRRSGYVRVTASLGNYALNKATAIGCRLRGDMGEALKYDQICDRIHLWLPAWARF